MSAGGAEGVSEAEVEVEVKGAVFVDVADLGTVVKVIGYAGFDIYADVACDVKL